MGTNEEKIGLLPYRRPLNVVVGRPIRVEQQTKPDDAYINEVHQKYMVCARPEADAYTFLK